MIHQTVFNKWKTIQIGNPGIYSNCIYNLEVRDMHIGCNARDVLRRSLSKFVLPLGWINLVKVSLFDLNLGQEATRKRIYRRARKLGLINPLIDVGFFLRLGYHLQPSGERLIVASRPAKHNGYLDLFMIESVKCPFKGSPKLWLRAVCGGASSYWSKEFQWIFLTP